MTAPLNALSVRRAKDRDAMGAYIVSIVQILPGCTAVIEPMPDRELWVRISAPRGVGLTIDLDGTTSQPDTHVLSWHSELGATFKFAPTFAPSVNPHHWHKATDICEGFEALCKTLTARLTSICNGSAFQ